MMHYQDRKVRLCRRLPQGGVPALTLVEMVVALAIMAIVFAAVLPEFRAVLNSWDSKVGAAEALQNGRVLMDHLYRNLSKAVRITAVSDSAETNGYIEFEDNDGSILRYDIGADNYVEFGPVGSLSELAGPVSQLQFTCYDACDLDTPTTDVNEIRSVKFNAMLLNLSTLSQDSTFAGQAYIRTNAVSFGASVMPGVAVSDKIEVESIGRIDAISGTIAVSTNSTGNDKVRVRDIGVIDGDVLVGPGGDPDRVIKLQGSGQITGSTGVLSQTVDIPVPTEPELEEDEQEYIYSGFGTTTISEDIRCQKFKIKDFAEVEISGNVTILAEEEFKVEDFGQLKLLEGATLTVYTEDKFEVKNSAKINVNTANSTLFMINHLGNEKIKIDGFSQLYATAVAPFAELFIKDSAEFYGTFRGKKVKIDDFGQLHTISDSAEEGILP